MFDWKIVLSIYPCDLSLIWKETADLLNHHVTFCSSFLGKPHIWNLDCGLSHFLPLFLMLCKWANNVRRGYSRYTPYFVDGTMSPISHKRCKMYLNREIYKQFLLIVCWFRCYKKTEVIGIFPLSQWIRFFLWAGDSLFSCTNTWIEPQALYGCWGYNGEHNRHILQPHSLERKTDFLKILQNKKIITTVQNYAKKYSVLEHHITEGKIMCKASEVRKTLAHSRNLQNSNAAAA